MRVSHASLDNQIFEPATVFESRSDLRDQLFRYIDRKPLFCTASVEHVTPVPLSGRAHTAIRAHARTFAKRQRSISHRPQRLQRGHEPLAQLRRCLLFLLFCMCDSFHTCNSDTKTNIIQYLCSNTFVRLAASASRCFPNPKSPPTDRTDPAHFHRLTRRSSALGGRFHANSWFKAPPPDDSTDTCKFSLLFRVEALR